MIYETEISIFNEDALKNKFSSIQTQFNVTLGKIAAIISDSDIEEYEEEGITMNSRLSSTIQDLDGVSTQVSSMQTSYDGQFTTVNSRLTQMDTTINGISATVSTVSQTAIKNDTIHYLATDQSSGVTRSTSGWTTTPQSIDATNRYLWIYHTYTKGNDSTTETDPVIAGVYGNQGQKGDTGDTGASGINTATVYLYQRSSSAPSVPSGTLTYTFADGSLSGTLGNWSQAIPSGSNPVYVTLATASSRDATDTIDSNEWVSPVVLAESGLSGYNQATINLYQRATIAPSKPSVATAYTFSTGVLTPIPTGWSTSVPTADGNPCYITTVSVFSRDDVVPIVATSWTAPVKLVEDGFDGVGISVITPLHYASNSSTPPSKPQSKVTTDSTSAGIWTTAIPNVTSSNQYMYTCDQIEYDDSPTHIDWTDVVQDVAISDLSTRISTAELKITDSAIVSTVTSSTDFTQAVTSQISQSADTIRLQASNIVWTSTYSSMTAQGVLTCTGANISGTLNVGGQDNSEGVINFYDETTTLAGTWTKDGIELIGKYGITGASSSTVQRYVPIKYNIREGVALWFADDIPKATLGQIPVSFRRQTLTSDWYMEFPNVDNTEPEDTPLTLTATTGFSIQVAKPLAKTTSGYYLQNRTESFRTYYDVTDSVAKSEFSGRVISKDRLYIGAESNGYYFRATYLSGAANNYSVELLNSVDSTNRPTLQCQRIVGENIGAYSTTSTVIGMGVWDFVSNIYTGSAIYARRKSGTTYYTVYASSFSQQSDERLKANIRDISDPVTTAIMNVPLKQFNMINTEDNRKLSVGAVAQDVVRELSQNGIDWRDYSIVGEVDHVGEKRYCLDYTQFIIARMSGLEKIIQEQNARIRALESMLN